MAILFKNNFHFVLNKEYIDPRGRFIIVDIRVANLSFTLVNLNAPNKDDPGFFQNITNRMLDFDCDNIVMGGDFNLILNSLNWINRVAGLTPLTQRRLPK